MQSILVNIAAQRLDVRDTSGTVTDSYIVSTAKNGAGERNGSFCTPRGSHVIRARIGDGCPVNTVFVGRRPTGEIYTPQLGEQFPGRDWMLTRILWLSGCEPGFNRLGEVDTHRGESTGLPRLVLLGAPGVDFFFGSKHGQGRR